MRRRGDSRSVNTGTGQLTGRAVAAWRGLASRERRLLVLLSAVALVAATVATLDWSARQKEAWTLAVADAGLRADVAAREAGRLDPGARREIDRLSAGALTADDIWLARILLEQRLAASAVAAGLDDARITVDEVADAAPVPDVLGARFEAAYDGAALVRFLDDLDAGVGLHAVQGLAVDREAGEVELQLVFPVRIAPGSAS